MSSSHRDKAERTRVVQDFLSSGLSVRQFCLEQNIPYTTFHGWKAAYNEAHVRSSAFIPVSVKPANGTPLQKSFAGAKLTLPKGIVLEFDSRADHTWISQILRGVM